MHISSDLFLFPPEIKKKKKLAVKCLEKEGVLEI